MAKFKKKTKNKGDVSIDLIFILFVSALSVGMLLLLFGAKLPAFSKTLYCKTAFFAQSSTFVPEAIRVDKNFCKEHNDLYVTRVFPKEAHIREFDIYTNSKEESQVQRLEFYNNEVLNFTLVGGDVMNATINITPLGDKADAAAYLFFNSTHYTIFPESPASTMLIQEPTRFSFLRAMNESLKGGSPSYYDDYGNCTEVQPCIFRMFFYATQASGFSTIAAYDMDVRYKRCHVQDEVLASVLGCWQRAQKGKLTENLICDELAITKQCYQEWYNYTEERITNIMKAERLCQDFSNNKNDQTGQYIACGEENNLLWIPNAIPRGGNVLVEYNATGKWIIVS